MIHIRPSPLSFLKIKPISTAQQFASEEPRNADNRDRRVVSLCCYRWHSFPPDSRQLIAEPAACLKARPCPHLHTHQELRPGVKASEVGPPGQRALGGRRGGGCLWRRSPRRRAGGWAGSSGAGPLARLLASGGEGSTGSAPGGAAGTGPPARAVGARPAVPQTGRGGAELGTGSPRAEAVRAWGGR